MVSDSWVRVVEISNVHSIDILFCTTLIFEFTCEIGTVTPCLCNNKWPAHLISEFPDFVLCFIAHNFASSHDNIPTHEFENIAFIINTIRVSSASIFD